MAKIGTMLVWCSRATVSASRWNRCIASSSATAPYRRTFRATLAPERGLLGLVDHAHAAPAELAEDPELAQGCRLLGSREPGRTVHELDAGETGLELRGQLRMVFQQLVAVGSLAGLEIGHVAVQDADQSPRPSRRESPFPARAGCCDQAGRSYRPRAGSSSAIPGGFGTKGGRSPIGPSHHHRAGRHCGCHAQASNDHGGKDVLARQGVGFSRGLAHLLGLVPVAALGSVRWLRHNVCHFTYFGRKPVALVGTQWHFSACFQCLALGPRLAAGLAGSGTVVCEDGRRAWMRRGHRVERIQTAHARAVPLLLVCLDFSNPLMHLLGNWPGFCAQPWRPLRYTNFHEKNALCTD